MAAELRVALVTNTPAPYRALLFERLNRAFENFSVLYVGPHSVEQPWVVEEVCRVERLSGLAGFVRLVRVTSTSDVVFVGGYERLPYFVAMAAARARGRRVVLFFDGIAPSRVSHPRRLRNVVKRLLVRLPHLCLVNGRVAQDYFARLLGVSPSRIRDQLLVPVPPTDGGRAEVGYDAVFVGRLVERKNASLFMEAMRLRPDLRGLLIGSGPEGEPLRQSAPDNVTFMGYQDRTRIDQHLRAAGCLVVPSVDEPWGLVVHEAIQLDVPCVASADMGATADLIRDGVNGVVLEELSPIAVASGVDRALQLDRVDLARWNADLVAARNLEAHAAAFIDAAALRVQ